MSLVVLDFECIENKIVNELGVHKNGHFVGCFFVPPKKSKVTSQSVWCTKHFHGINWSRSHENYTELEKILKQYFAKLYEKSKTLSEILETKVTSLDDYAWPKVQK